MTGDRFKLFSINGVLKVDYSKLSDFDINGLVSIIKGLTVTCYDLHEAPYVWDEMNNREFNPCNNPSDAWSIILDNKISIFPISGDTWQAEHALTGAYKDKNPLRAAMIVFLMMQGDKN